MQVFMQPGSPMPPIATKWFKYHHQCVVGWTTLYTTDIMAFRELVPNVATQDMIDLSSQ